MNYLLLGLLLLGPAVQAQVPAWAGRLPTTNGHVAYRGRLNATGLTQRQTLARATRFVWAIPPDRPLPDSAQGRLLRQLAHHMGPTELPVKPVFVVDSSEAGYPIVRGTAAQTFPLQGESMKNQRLPLHYTLVLRPRAGYCEYELTSFVLEQPAVQLAEFGHYNLPIHRPIEQVLANFAYESGANRPDQRLVRYCEAVNQIAQQLLRAAQVALKKQ